MKTLIAVPCMDHVPVQFAESLLNLQKPPDTKVCFKANSLIYDSRNLLSLTAIENGFDHVLWLDSDMVIPPDGLHMLSTVMEELRCDMVTGLYFKRKFPTVPVIWDELDAPEVIDGTPVRHLHEYEDYYRQPGIFPVQGCGFGCVLTSTSLLKKVWDRFGPAFTPYPWGGEDISFCYRVKQLGFPMYCDRNVSCGHVGQFIYTEELFMKSRGEEH